MSATGWLVFLVLIGVAMASVPVAAALIRRRLPEHARKPEPVEPMAFGHSPKAQRSPRHAVLYHRSLLIGFFLALAILLLVPGALAIRELGVSAIQVGIAFVLPTLLVTLHARTRGQDT